MGYCLTSKAYVEYLRLVYNRIHENSEYISALDAATGDGDHWANMETGFRALIENSDEIAQQPITKAFQKIGMLMMTKIGGSSGILYGSAYMAAAKAVDGCEALNNKQLCAALSAMVVDMMERGKSKPGMKTMIDTLWPASRALREAIEAGNSEKECLLAMKNAAAEGCEATKGMEAVRGRASYQSSKGVGHLDPGAVTMNYQLEILCDYICGKLL